MAKARRRKASLHSAGKVVAKELLEHADALAEDPERAVPRCVHGGFFCPFKSARRKILKIATLKDDAKALDKHARGRNRLARAYAATLRMRLDGKIPVVAEMKLPGGSVPYVVRGTATPFELAGLQHYDEPHLNLLSVSHYVKKQKRHVYATPEGLVCTGSAPHPPKDFVEEELAELDLNHATDTEWVSTHATDPHEDVLAITWKSAGVTAKWAARDLEPGSSKLHQLARHIAMPGVLSDFDVQVRLSPLEGDGAPDVAPDITDAVAAYKKRAVDDVTLIERAHDARAAELRARGGRAFVAGNRWFGSDADALVTSLDPTPVERRALEAALRDVDRPVVVAKASATRVLADVWADHGRAALEAAANGHAPTAAALHDADAGADAIGDALKRAAARGATAAVAAELPNFKRLPAQAAVADAIARAFKAGGRDEAVRVALAKARETPERGVALAFLKSLGGTSAHDWKFQRVDQEMADALEPHATTLLDATGRTYADELEKLSRRAGATKSVEVA